MRNDNPTFNPNDNPNRERRDRTEEEHTALFGPRICWDCAGVYRSCGYNPVECEEGDPNREYGARGDARYDYDEDGTVDQCDTTPTGPRVETGQPFDDASSVAARERMEDAVEVDVDDLDSFLARLNEVIAESE